jgi:hypothetical protein
MDGKRHEIDLGSCHVVGLARARELARWGEVDLEARLWTVPHERMKAAVLRRMECTTITVHGFLQQ